MKKLLVCILLVICIMFAGCNTDKMYGVLFPDHPYEFPNSKWECSNPKFWFMIERIYTDDGRWGDESGSYIQSNKGQFEHNGTIYDIDVEIDTDSLIMTTYIDGKRTVLLSGLYHCYSGKCEIEPWDKKEGPLFNDQYDDIIAYRVE